jgi:pyridoxine/pyridoxamine 5'-phosphate oxidase
MDAALSAALDGAWALLAEGARNRRSPVHVPVVASIDSGGLPTQRVLVLREADRARAMLRFHTDARSPKTGELADGAAAHVLAYHPEEKVQLRLCGTAQVVRDGSEVDAVWAASTRFARRCYLAEAAPGTGLAGPASGLPAAVEGREPDEAELVPARPNFALLKISVCRIDWLYLANSGHRRALFERGGDAWAGRWVVP